MNSKFQNQVLRLLLIIVRKLVFEFEPSTKDLEFIYELKEQLENNRTPTTK